MGTTVKLVLRKSKKRKDGTSPIWIRVTANRKSRFKSTGISIPERYWNADKELVRKSHDIAPALNDKLKRLKLEAQKKALDAPSAQVVKDSLGGSSGSLTAFFESFIDRLDRKGRFWDWKKYRVTLGKLRDCHGQHIHWKEIDRAALEKFENCLRSKYDNNPATVRKEMQRLSRVFKEAKKEGVIRIEQDPFQLYDMPKGSKPDRRKLSTEEINAIENLELEFGTQIRTARDVFLTAFYAGGMRFADVAMLKPAQVKNGRVDYRMLKTDTPISNPIPERLKALLKAYLDAAGFYLFALLEEGAERDPVHLRRRISSKNVIVNRELKKIAEQAGIEPDGLTMHVARHSFADYARRKGGNLYAISKTLGHKDLATTQVYLSSLDQEAVDNLAEELWR